MAVVSAPISVPLSDEQLIARFMRGDRKALEGLFARHRDTCYRVAYRLLGHEADALAVRAALAHGALPRRAGAVHRPEEAHPAREAVERVDGRARAAQVAQRGRPARDDERVVRRAGRLGDRGHERPDDAHRLAVVGRERPAAGLREHEARLAAARVGIAVERERLGEPRRATARLHTLLDAFIPRGGPGLRKTALDQVRVPVLCHESGVSTVYVDVDVDLPMAQNLVINAKLQQPSASNSVDTLLVQQATARAARRPPRSCCSATPPGAWRPTRSCKLIRTTLFL